MLVSISQRIATKLNIKINQVESTVALLDDGATVPFIARYRKEVTGNLDDAQLRDLVENLTYLRELDARRETIINSIQEQGKLTPELETAIFAAENKTTLEDLYLPYKPKRRTKAMIAREAGLEPLAMILLEQQNLTPENEATKYINPDKNINEIKDALDGARHILMELFAENAELLAKLRQKLWNEGLLTSKVKDDKSEEGVKFSDYFAYGELIKLVPSHRALAVLRGSNEGFLDIGVAYQADDTPKIQLGAYENIILDIFAIKDNLAASSWLIASARLAWKAKIFISLETELISKMREDAETEAMSVFAKNLHNLLLQAPAGSMTTLGLDPGIRTGVKVAVVDNTGKVLDTAVVYPFQPHNKVTESLNTLEKLVIKHNIQLISIGNGTASRETDALAGELIKRNSERSITKVVVSEAGASVYSASAYASKELPDMDVSLRGAVSIARRLQDPLAELVKIDPKAIGVGQYQHDLNQTKLSQMLDNVIEDCVNAVGVDVNTASIPLLSHVSGLNSIIATNIVNYRDQNGRFKNRAQLKKVSRLGEKTFEQCAGFLRINDGENPLDKSSVHPESYPLVDVISQKLATPIDQLINNSILLKQIKPTELANEEYGILTITDVLKELEKPGRDPRGEFKMAKFKDGVNEINDLLVGMELEGVISNVTNFGAFVDIGVHQDGLVHISEITDQYISNPNEVLKTGQIVKVKVMEIDAKRKRIALSMKGLNKINVPAGAKPNSRPSSVAIGKSGDYKSDHKKSPPQATNAFSEAFAKLKR